jgi:hypothetical protein
LVSGSKLVSDRESGSVSGSGLVEYPDPNLDFDEYMMDLNREKTYTVHNNCKKRGEEKKKQYFLKLMTL